ncbi:uncharacterized protein LOC125501491 [Athalia rosae]|uniref:uncharacterized protein LOC125501491 n=1 Tax=Athalia rosae TaxID=37344 RepID=UPI0020347C6E|nr:uncharacterized protein LOC125501491 [Athalia rosae]XP_048513601.1 uncharacterized protein LOC125501491 [Athalia rosae]XP_048513602.1 uncharacterized protein LOC125501491 [Athalia rosae]
MRGILIQTRRICENTSTVNKIELEFDLDGINLPCRDITEFTIFERKLSDTPSFRDKIVCKLASMANTSQAMVHSATPMTRFVMSRDLTLTCNLKKANDRSINVFLNTYQVLRAVVVNIFLKSSDDQIADSTRYTRLCSQYLTIVVIGKADGTTEKRQPNENYLQLVRRVNKQMGAADKPGSSSQFNKDPS